MGLNKYSASDVDLILYKQKEVFTPMTKSQKRSRKQKVF